MEVDIPRKNKRKKSKLKNNKSLYLLLAIPVVYVFIFNYIPIYGLLIAFKNYRISKGILGSDWVGLQNFIRFFESPLFLKTFINTLVLNFYSLLTFPIPILLAVGINHMSNLRVKKAVQMITYAPYFISIVILVGMMSQMLSVRYGMVNHVIELFGMEPVNFMGDPKYFRHVYVWSDVWRNSGYEAVIYISALAGVSTSLHEAAMIDGANVWKRIWNIDFPSILPTIVILFILRMGRIMVIGIDKVLLMQNTMNLKVSETIQTYVYKVGLTSAVPNYSYATAIGLFQSVIAVILLISVNLISKRLVKESLW